MVVKKKLISTLKWPEALNVCLWQRKYQSPYCVLLFTLKLKPTVRLFHS